MWGASEFRCLLLLASQSSEHALWSYGREVMNLSVQASSCCIPSSSSHQLAGLQAQDI